MPVVFRPVSESQLRARIHGWISLFLAIASVLFFAPAIGIQEWGRNCKGCQTEIKYGLWKVQLRPSSFEACVFVLTLFADPSSSGTTTYQSLLNNCGDLGHCAELNVVRVFAVLALVAAVFTAAVIIVLMKSWLLSAVKAIQQAQPVLGVSAGVFALIAWATFCDWWQTFRGLGMYVLFKQLIIV